MPPNDFLLHHERPSIHLTCMSSQTVTRTIESDFEPKLIYQKLTDAYLIPQWGACLRRQSRACARDHLPSHKRQRYV